MATEHLDNTSTASIKAPPGFYKISGKIIAATDKATLFRATEINGAPLDEEDTKDDWIPLSQTKSIIRPPFGSDELDVLIISEWIARTKGFI